MTLDQLRSRLREATHWDEHQCVEWLLDNNTVTDDQRQQALDLARQLVNQCRQQPPHAGSLDVFLQEFGLSNNEGVALMCLAESLLRIPDKATADKLITEKLQSGQWRSHLGHSTSLFVNASVWGLMLTGKILPLVPQITSDTSNWFKRLSARLGESVIRSAILQAMEILGNQFVLGAKIEDALSSSAHAQTQFAPQKLSFSFDMLGEGARTEQDAKRYFDAYAHAIHQIGQHQHSEDIYAANSISIKLSALYPRYEPSQQDDVISVLLPRINALALTAKSYGIGLSIDAEEARRLDLSLTIFESLARSPQLSNWQGLGFVLQSYQKRAPLVTQWLIALARETKRRLMVRLVKGAYWDTEIKWAQERGFTDYPVFTRKVNTDLCYQHCAQLLLSSPQAIYPQFATHNAHTIAMILATAGNQPYEFQRLHGMGQLLYDMLYNPQNEMRSKADNPPPLRVYAPVGQHRELLPYLVRRLLENGANSSFVNRLLDKHVSVEQLVQPIEEQVIAVSPHRHRDIPLPAELYRHAGEPRLNASGLDLDNPQVIEPLLLSMKSTLTNPHIGGPIVGGELRASVDKPLPVIRSPFDRSKHLGHVSHASEQDIHQALTLAHNAQPEWDLLGGEYRAQLLDHMADAIEKNRSTLMALIGAEAGRTIGDALSEVREAVDFCRYYALQARRHFTRPRELPGPTGELNQLSLHGRGVFFCISPWNFPLAIFTGQITAALAAGNTVIAKPAESTSLVATFATQLFHQVGIPADVLHLITGNGGNIGKRILTNNAISGVAFTGSTATAKIIQQHLASRPGPIVPLIAETGGQNVMVADSTALPEQLVDDVVQSAFLSAGQRCSALRVLYLQEDVADPILAMLTNALQTYRLGDPTQLNTDIGPVIDEQAQQKLLAHIEKMTSNHRLIGRVELTEQHQKGCFVPPHIFEIDTLQQLPEEVFGPILHIIRYKHDEIDQVVQQINDSGFGLTLGIHSRIEAFANYLFTHTQIGNTYVNRNMVGAVVGTQPFGGCKLSGTGPKAGGPHYLFRFATEKTRSDNLTARGGNTTLFRLRDL